MTAAALVCALAACGGGGVGREDGSTSASSVGNDPGSALGDESNTTAGSSSQTASEGATEGRVFPAQSGLTVVEYDAAGQELQRATTTDFEGRFKFVQPVSGERLVAVVGEGATLRAPRVLSARFSGSRQAIQLSQLTTLQDQLMVAGDNADVAAAAATELLRKACGTDALDGLQGGLVADGVSETVAPREWLLAAMTGYDTALRRVGVSPYQGAVLWRDKFRQHLDLLGRMCGVAQTIHSTQWVSETTESLALATGTTVQAATVVLAQPSLTQRVLDLLSYEALPLAYPMEAGAVGLRPEQWQGREAALAATLLKADLESRSGVDTGTVSRQALVRSAGEGVNLPAYRFDRYGTLVASLESTADLVAKTGTKTVKVLNQGATDATVDLYVNGHRLKNISDVTAEILAMPQRSADEPLHVKAWRYLTTMTSHGWTISAGLFVHQPDLYLRSLGIGYCDDVSAALHWIWTALGYQARVYTLNGHVVAEVLVNGRWEMYDADYQGYYFNRAGLVAGAAELQQDPSLIYSPTNPFLPLTAPSYWPGLADIYADTSAFHGPHAWYSTAHPDPVGGDVVIPAGGYLEVDGRVNYSMSGYEGAGSSTFATLRIWVPAGYAGRLALSGVLADIQGSGQVTVLGANRSVTAAGLRSEIQAYYARSFDAPATAVEVQRSEGMTITMLANPSVYRKSDRMRVQIVAPKLSGISIQSADSAEQFN